MSVAFDHGLLDEAEKIVTAEEMYRLGIEASTPGVGDAVDIDLVTAHKWFNLAAMQGNQEALAYRQQLTMEMSTRQVAEAQRKAREWLKRVGPVLKAAS